MVVELLIEGTHTGPMNGMEPTSKALAFRDVTILRRATVRLSNSAAFRIT